MLNEEQAVSDLLNSYISGELTRDTFTEKYKKLSENLESLLDEGLYHPLHIIVPTEENSDRAWKENMRSMYLNEISELDKLLEDDEPSYSEMLTEEKQKELCQEAIMAIPRFARERTVASWVKKNLIEDEEFVFMQKEGISKFGSVLPIYDAALRQKSILMTALFGGLGKLEFNYYDLIKELRSISKCECIWVLCSEPDGFSTVNIAPWYADQENEIENFNWLEYSDPESTQGGPCYLLFMPEDTSWMLLHENNFEKITISLHAKEKVMAQISDLVKNA